MALYISHRYIHMGVKENLFLSLDGDASYKTVLSTKTKIEMAKTIGGFSFHCST